MKKFTLLLLSMFFMLGTSVAQDGTETKFELVFSSPSSAQPASRVDVIQLMFSKDVKVELPENDIIIKNVENDDQYKVVQGMAYGPNAILYIQQVTESTKEEDVVTYISTPGTYTYTIPEGVISSVDGEVFAEYTATFTVGEPFSIVSVSPTQTDKLEKIQITFNKEVAEVVMPNSGLSVVDMYWSPVANIKNEVTISDDKKTVTFELENAITTPGQYNLDLYNNVVTSVDGMKNEYTSLAFNVVDYTPAYITNIEDGDKVQEFKNLEITFNNVNEVKLVDGADKVTVYMPGQGEATGTATLADNKITVTFDQEFTEEGDYMLYIPAGMFTMDGAENEERLIEFTLYTFTVTPLEIKEVVPAGGSTVDKLEKIIITYNQPVTIAMDENWQMISGQIKMTCGDKEYTLTYNSSSNASDQIEYLVNAEWTGYEYESTPVTEEGTYTINLADIVVNYAAEDYVDEWGWPAKKWHGTGSVEGTCSWTISAESSIGEVAADGGVKVIYDLTGRRVENITKAGIYIINGKKAIVK